MQLLRTSRAAGVLRVPSARTNERRAKESQKGIEEKKEGFGQTVRGRQGRQGVTGVGAVSGIWVCVPECVGTLCALRVVGCFLEVGRGWRNWCSFDFVYWSRESDRLGCCVDVV